jgi:predicted dehydrogenase
MTTPKIRVGIVGLQPGRSWAAVAHLPALRQLADRFEIVGVANSSLESSRAAAEACGVPQAFASVEEMASSDAIDLAVVTIRVPLHYDAVKTILSKSKHIYCEWPLGRTSAEAEEMAALARDRRVLAAIGTQARVAPAVRKLAELVKGGAIGSVVSSSIRGWATPWGATISDTKNEEYLRKEASGADLLTIPFAHMLAAARDVLGDIAQVSASLDTRYPRVKAEDTGNYIDADAPDSVAVIAALRSGAPLSIDYKGGQPAYGDGLVWEIEGTKGGLVVTADSGHGQVVALKIRRYDDSNRGLRDIGRGW